MNKKREDHDEPSAIKRMGTAEEMGKTIAFLLSDESSFTTGTVCKSTSVFLNLWFVRKLFIGYISTLK